MVSCTKQTCRVCGNEINDNYTYWQFTTGWEGNEVGKPEMIHSKCRFESDENGEITAFLEGYERFNYKPEDL